MLKNCLARAIGGLLLLCAGFSASAATDAFTFADWPYVITRPGENRLPQNTVLSIVQSKDGYLWIGTLNGLVRFDGIRFTVFDEASVPALNSRRIVYLFEDSRTNLWVGTQSDGIVLIKRDGSIQSFNPGQAGPLTSISEDVNGVIWLNTTDQQVVRYRGNQFEKLKVSARPVAVERSGLLWMWLSVDQKLVGLTAFSNSPALVVAPEIPAPRVDYLLASRNGGVWRLMDGRVQKWTKNQLERDLGPYPWSESTGITSACEDNDGNLIVATQDSGVYWFDSPGKTNQITSLQGLSHNTALSVCVDREGDLWIGTDGGGLNRVKRKSFRVLERSQGLYIPTVCEDGDGGLWFANPGWRLLFRKGEVTKEYGSAEGLWDTRILSVGADRERTIWVGTFSGLYFLRTNATTFQRLANSERFGSISAIYRDRTDRLWAGTQYGLLCRDGQAWKTFTTRDGLTANDVRAITEDDDGNIWAGTERAGLNCLRNGKILSFRKNKDGLPSDNVSALWADAGGVLWVGTTAGLGRLQDGKWTRYTTSEGLAANGINSLIDDGQGNLWAGSYAGIMRLPKKSLNDFARNPTNTIVCRTYDGSDGLPTSECAQGSQPAACRTPDGRLWFATINGLVSVRPTELKPNLFEPPVIIESVYVEGEKQNTNNPFNTKIDTVVVPPGKEHLDIYYTSLNLGAADRARFKYRLEGHEAWIDNGNLRVARYLKLPPNKYRFQVKACNEDGIWNETGATLAIVVQPPFWRTAWFLTVSAASLIALIAGIVYYFSTQKLQRQLAVLKQQEALEKERGRIARDLHDELGANLMQVALLGELAEGDKHLPGEVESHARQISQTARETTKALDEIVWAVNPSNDSLEGLINYVCKYAQEYFELAGLRYRLEVPPQLPGATVPPEVRHNVFLAAKEAINNVVKHAQASAAWVRLRLDPGSFVLEIEDNGRGLAGVDEKSGRNGLRNMRKRLEDVGGSFSIVPAPTQGTVVRLTAPIRNH